MSIKKKELITAQDINNLKKSIQAEFIRRNQPGGVDPVGDEIINAIPDSVSAKRLIRAEIKRWSRAVLVETITQPTHA